MYALITFLNLSFSFFQDRDGTTNNNVVDRIGFADDFLLDIFGNSTTRQVRLKNRNNWKDIRTLVIVPIAKDTYPKTGLQMGEDGKFVFYVDNKALGFTFQ